MESGNGNNVWKMPDKCDHAIYRLDRTVQFLCSIV